MILYVNENGEIKDVGTTSDTSLTPVEVTDGTFDGWSVAKICCYKVQVNNGIVTMITPCVDSRLIEHINQLGKQAEAITPYKDTKTAYIGDTEVTFLNTPSGNLTVYFPYEYSVQRSTDRIIISFAELDEVTDITISIA